MNKTKLFAKNLLEIPDGQYFWKKKVKYWKFFEKYKYFGWLAVETKDNHKSFMWTSGKEHHWPYDGNGPARNLTINKETGEVLHYMESAISMWIKWSVWREGDDHLPSVKKFIKEIEYFMIEAGK